MPEDSKFARTVSLACHDLRTPLAAVQGFARTIPRVADLPEEAARHLQMIDEAASEMAGLLDQLGLLTRIERGTYEPNLVERDTLELARGAAAMQNGVRVEGVGAAVQVDAAMVERGLAALARAALRHAGLDEVLFEVRGPEIRLSPTTPDSVQVLTSDELRDLGAAVARRAIEAAGGSLCLDGDALVVALAQ